MLNASAHLFTSFQSLLIRKQKMRTCRCCGRELPDEQFELYSTGTRRRVCRQCKYRLYGPQAKRRWQLRQMAALIVNSRK